MWVGVCACVWEEASRCHSASFHSLPMTKRSHARRAVGGTRAGTTHAHAFKSQSPAPFSVDALAEDVQKLGLSHAALEERRVLHRATGTQDAADVDAGGSASDGEEQCSSEDDDAPQQPLAAGGVNGEAHAGVAAGSAGAKRARPPHCDVAHLNIGAVRAQLRKMGLETTGAAQVVRKRLKAALRLPAAERTHTPGMPPFTLRAQPFDAFCVLDFEATCEENVPFDSYPHEIIELPVVLVCARTLAVLGEFHTYCRPVRNPTLTPFCTKLTGIQQATVDAAPVFSDALAQLEAWMRARRLSFGDDLAHASMRWGCTEGGEDADSGARGTLRCVFATDGPWDFRNFLQKQSGFSGIPVPAYARRWVNVRKQFCNYYGAQKGGINAMLDALGLRFVGSEHSGIDDARNIAAVLVRLLGDGCVVKPNEKLAGGSK